MVYRTAPFSMTLNDPYPQFQLSRHSLTLNKRYDRHSFNEILIGTYTRPTQQCHFEWPWVILSDLAKYSMTRSVARSLCDSWASCRNDSADHYQGNETGNGIEVRPLSWSFTRYGLHNARRWVSVRRIRVCTCIRFSIRAILSTIDGDGYVRSDPENEFGAAAANFRMD